MSKKDLLEEIAQKVVSCKKCPLYKSATNPVPGNGNPNAEILFVGEAPGFWEDQKGIPFCGLAGKLLDELLASIDLDRSKVFVANMLRHRPPDNREPLSSEMEACREFLDDQIDIIKPKAIVTLGRFSLTKFLPYEKISKDHGKGRIIEYNKERYFLIPMFHPAAALRTAEIEKQLRDDFKKIPEEIKRLERVANPEPIGIKEEKKEEQLSLV